MESKPRFEILDGLRGVGAFIVVAFRLFETYSKGPLYQVLHHGSLAVARMVKKAFVDEKIENAVRQRAEQRFPSSFM